MKTKAKRTKTMRRFALTAALLLILALLLAFDALNGDPLSQQWAIYWAIRYAEKLYPAETFHWDQRTAPDGQFFHYVVYVQSDQSGDTNFAVQTWFWLMTDDEIRGKEFEPDHVFYVDHRSNTACTHRQLRRPQCIYGRCTGIRPDTRRQNCIKITPQRCIKNAAGLFLLFA